MAETEVFRQRGNPGIKEDAWTGTITITITGAAVTADSADITLDPVWASAPKVVYGYSVARTGNAGATSVEVKTNSSTVLAFTGKVSTAPGGAATTIITVRYLLIGDARQT